MDLIYYACILFGLLLVSFLPFGFFNTGSSFSKRGVSGSERKVMFTTEEELSS